MKTTPSRNTTEETVMIEMPSVLYLAVMRECRKRKITFSEFAREAVREEIATRQTKTLRGKEAP